MIGTALLLTATLLGAGTNGSQPQPVDSGLDAPIGRQQTTSGVIVAGDIEGRLAIYDEQQRLVVELNKRGGRQVQLALEPGAYEARLDRGGKHARFDITSGQQLLLGLANFEEARGAADAHAGTTTGRPSGWWRSERPEARHRLEFRLGAWGDTGVGRYDRDSGWDFPDSLQASTGIEYLRFIRDDLGVGVGLSALVRVDDGWRRRWDEGASASRATVMIPVVARWYPLRRVTDVRAIEPYITGGIGPVFGVDAVYEHDGDRDDDEWRGHHDWNWDWDDDDDLVSARAGTTLGGRVGAGFDVRLGSIFRIGLAGAWNWDAGFDDGMWRGRRPRGGEANVVFAWVFGR